jgi:hypothetical protein
MCLENGIYRKNDIDVSRDWYLQEKWYLTSNLWDCQQAELVRISHGASKISQVIMESSLKNRNLRQIALIVAVKIFNYTHWERDGDTVKVNAWLFSYNKLFIKVIYRVLSNLSAVVTVSPGTPFLSTSTRPLYPEKKKKQQPKEFIKSLILWSLNKIVSLINETEAILFLHIYPN